MARIERDYRQAPGWWATLSHGQQVRLLALYRILDAAETM